MSEDIKPGNAAIPPRLSIKVPGQTGEVAVAPQAPSDPAVAAVKRKTSRIALSQVSAEPGAPAAPVSGIGLTSKTIRLSPAIGGVPIPSTPVGKALSGILMASPDEAKYKTSRIPLEAVLSGKSEAPAGAGGDAIPKTIRVKRPTITAPPKVVSSVEAPVSAAPSPVPAGAPVEKNQTARVDILPDAAAEAQQTQKKTIKIRRAEGSGPEARVSPRNVSIARSEGELAGLAEDAGGARVAAPHWIFPVMAAAALFVMGFMIYVLAAQAYPGLGWSLGG